MKKAIVSVTNDLVTDQRVHKVCLVLMQCNYEVLLVGRKLPNSLPIKREYHTHRMNLFFRKSAFFYAEYTIRLSFFLLFRKANLFISNDLDTLLPNFLVSRIKGTHLVYDSHEYFTEVPELQNNKFKKWVWEKIEGFIFQKLEHVFTVNDSIADLYSKKYSKKVGVVRNMPLLNKGKIDNLKTRTELNLPTGKKIILMQGAGINIDRGAEEAVAAMQFIDDAILLIIGGGDVLYLLKEIVIKLNIHDKIMFKDKMPYQELIQYTMNSDLGLTLDKDTNLNYRYSLPNKLFDYIHAGIPVLASSLPEIKKILKKYDVGELIDDHDPKHIAEKVNSMLRNIEKIKIWKENTKIAAQELCWENEAQLLISVYSSFA